MLVKKKETYTLLNTKMNRKDFKEKIQDLFIVRENDGSYVLFGKYSIVPTNNNEYIVNIFGEKETYTFFTLRHAVTWCVFEKNRKYKEIKRVHELDNELVSIEASIENHERLVLKSKDENKYIYQAKLYEEKLKKRKMLQEINEFATLSKYMQNKKFAENQDN